MLLGGLLAANAAAADDPNASSYFNMSIAELMDVEIYSASKYSQRASQAPSWVTIITQDEIKLYGYRNITDILRSVPGFYDTYDRNYSYIGVRGFGRPGDYNARILTLIDGHRLNDNVGDLILFGNEFPLDIDLIDRVEIVRGPGSALYGSNALFAVVSIFTKTGRDYQGGETAATLGNDDYTQGRFTYGRRYENGFDFLASGTYAEWGREKLYYPEFDDPATQFGKVDNDDETAGKYFIEASYLDFKLHIAGSQREKGIPTAPFDTAFGQDNRTWDDYTLVGLTWEHEVDDSLSILGRFSYHHYNYDGRYYYDDGGIYENKDYWKGRWVIGEVQAIKQFDNGHKVVFGADSQYNIRQDQKNWDSEAVYLNDRRHSKNWGIYVQDEFKLTDDLTVNAGVRKDYYDATGSTVNPRTALIYTLTQDTILKLIAGKAFRAPSANESYYEDGYSAKPNSELDAETIKTYEAIVEQRLSEHWKTTVSTFYYQIDDLLNQVVDPMDGLIQFQNTSEVTASGFETAFEGNWEGGLRGRISFSCIQTMDKITRSSLTNSPQHIAHFNLIYPLIREKLFAGIDAGYTGKRKTLAGDHTDDVIVTNLTLTYVNALKNLDAQFGVYNLFDIEYDYPGFLEHEQDMLEQDERTVAVKFTYRF